MQLPAKLIAIEKLFRRGVILTAKLAPGNR